MLWEQVSRSIRALSAARESSSIVAPPIASACRVSHSATWTVCNETARSRMVRALAISSSGIGVRLPSGWVSTTTPSTSCTRDIPSRMHSALNFRAPATRASSDLRQRIPSGCDAHRERSPHTGAHVGGNRADLVVDRQAVQQLHAERAHGSADDAAPGPGADNLRIPVKVISDSGLNVISESGQSDHRSERSDAGVGL